MCSGGEGGGGEGGGSTGERLVVVIVINIAQCDGPSVPVCHLD